MGRRRCCCVGTGTGEAKGCPYCISDLAPGSILVERTGNIVEGTCGDCSDLDDRFDGGIVLSDESTWPCVDFCGWEHRWDSLVCRIDYLQVCVQRHPVLGYRVMALLAERLDPAATYQYLWTTAWQEAKIDCLNWNDFVLAFDFQHNNTCDASGTTLLLTSL